MQPPAAPISSEPLVSIIINNFNYGRFVGEAIESALAQRYPRCEVIVVDDGSADDSPAVIAGYGDRVIAVLKPNGGQGSAFNAGLARSQGEIVFFLDADDRLAPHIAGEVVAHFRAEPSLVRVQFRLRVIDGAGQPTGALVLPREQPLASGDLRAALLRSPDDLAWLPTSGNAFAAWALRRIFPMPEAPYRLCADYYLSNLTPLFGTVRSLEAPGGDYRVHGTNNHHTTAIDLRQTRETICRTAETHRHLRRVAGEIGLLPPDGPPPDFQSLSLLAHRLVSLRLAPDAHPVAGDHRAGIVARAWRTAWGRRQGGWAMPLLWGGWFGVAAVAPRALVPSLARLFFAPDARGALAGVVTHLRGALALSHRAEGTTDHAPRNDRNAASPDAHPSRNG